MADLDHFLGRGRTCGSQQRQASESDIELVIHLEVSAKEVKRGT
jgi:hypothetical protein